MKLFSIFLISLSCFCWKPPFEFIGATSQVQVSGVADGGSTTNYRFTIVANKSSKQLSFDAVNISGESMKVQAYQKISPFSFKADFEKGDTVLLVASQYHRNNRNELPGKEGVNENKPESGSTVIKQNMPCDCKGKAYLLFNLKGKPDCLCIDEIKRLKNLYMP